MPSNAELLILRHLPQRPEDYTIKKLEGGISSDVYKVEGVNRGESNQIPVVFTLFRDSADWWKVDKEVEVRQLVKNDVEVLIPKLYDAGFDTLEGKTFGYLMREFITGEDMHTVLESRLSGENRDEDVRDLARDLGYRFAALHSHNASLYGMIGNREGSKFQSWEDYVLTQIADETRLFSALSKDRRIGRVSAGKVNEMLPQLEIVVGSNQSSLKDITDSALAHGDAHLGNVIANNGTGSWRVKGMIDIEAAVGGDPEIDVSFVENWLYIFPYKDDFYKQAETFKQGYSTLRQPSYQYSQRRLVYHTFRSLAYLRTVLEFNQQEFLRDHPRGEMYVDRHMQILESLAEGNNLEDINLRALL